MSTQLLTVAGTRFAIRTESDPIGTGRPIYRVCERDGNDWLPTGVWNFRRADSVDLAIEMEQRAATPDEEQQVA